MANRSFQRLQALDKEIKIIHGQFAVGSTGAPTVSTNGTINFIALNASGAAAEIGSGETVHFMFVLKNSALPGVGVS